MHEVSLRAATNRMDAHNLAVVLCPNLISGHNPARDVMMCTVPGGVSMSNSDPRGSNPAALSEGRTTLGSVIKLCIQRYYEVFDDIRDRSEALPPQRVLGDDGAASSEASSDSRITSHKRMSSGLYSNDDDEDIDDAMLVMPIGPSHSNGSGPPSAWGVGYPGAGNTHKQRHRNTLSGGSAGVRSMHTVIGQNGATGYSYASASKAKSMISIEKGIAANGIGTVGRKGSISVGRGTTRKSSGAGVEAISITAEGFFSAPASAPPVPPLRRSTYE